MPTAPMVNEPGSMRTNFIRMELVSSRGGAWGAFWPRNATTSATSVAISNTSFLRMTRSPYATEDNSTAQCGKEEGRGGSGVLGRFASPRQRPSQIHSRDHHELTEKSVLCVDRWRNHSYEDKECQRQNSDPVLKGPSRHAGCVGEIKRHECKAYCQDLKPTATTLTRCVIHSLSDHQADRNTDP